MLAYHNNPSIKDKYLERVRAHALADEIVQGVYYEIDDGKVRACGVGCTIHSSDHGAYETELGIPRILARLEDLIFEGLPLEISKTWPERFLSAITPGADLAGVWPKFAIWLLVDAEHGVIRYAASEKIKTAIERVAELYRIGGTKEQFRDAAYAAADAADAAYAADAACAADAAAYAADAADAACAAYAAAYAAADAAYAAAYAAADAADAAADAAREKAFIRQSEKLLELLEKALEPQDQ